MPIPEPGHEIKMTEKVTLTNPDNGATRRVFNLPSQIEKWEARGYVANSEQVVDETPDLDAMTVDQLREFAADNGIDLEGANKKDAVRAAIDAAIDTKGDN